MAPPKPKPVRDDANAVMVPRVAAPQTRPQTDLEPGMGTTTPPPARPARRGPMITTPETDSQSADSRSPVRAAPVIDPQPASDPPPAAEPVPGADRPAATSLSWPSGEGTDPAPAAPDAAGVAPAERWNDPWGEQPAAPPRPTTRQADPWADPPVAAPRSEQAPPSGDAPMPPQMESPPETDPPGPSN